MVPAEPLPGTTLEELMRISMSITRVAVLLAVALLLTFGCQTANTPSGVDGDEGGGLGVAKLQGPAIRIEKATNGFDADSAPGPTIEGDQIVEWTYLVTNTGDVPLDDVQVTDDQGVAVSCPMTTLQPGESMTCSGQGNSQLGQYANVGTATGTTPDGLVVQDDDPSHYFGEPDSMVEMIGVDIEKSTDGFDADFAPGPTLNLGAPVTWTYIVTNLCSYSSDTLKNVTVTDDQGVAVSCPKTALAGRESMTCTANGTVQLGQYANIGAVTAEWYDRGSYQTLTLTDEDASHYFGELGEQTGDDGCSHGYWKNHTAAWDTTDATPGTGLGSVFSAAATLDGFENLTLMDALKFKGGKGVAGAARILLRQAVAAWLNAKHPGVAYPRLATEIVDDVNAAIAGGDRHQMIELAGELDVDNNLGCSLSTK
jgi:hypothetical protein